MKSHSSRIAMVLLLALSTSLLGKEGYAFFNVVNLLPGEENCEVTVAEKSLLPGGLESGKATGWFMVPVDGDRTLTMDTASLRKKTAELDLADGDGLLVVIFLENSPPASEGNRVKPPKLSFRTYPTFPSDSFGLRLITFALSEQQFQIGPTKVEAVPFIPVDVANWNGGRFSVKKEGEIVGKMPSQEKGSYYLLIAQGPNHDHLAVMVNSDEQIAPPWIEEKKDD